jgi:hypothetical protein
MEVIQTKQPVTSEDSQELVDHMAEEIITWLYNEMPIAVVERMVEKLSDETWYKPTDGRRRER